MMLDLSSKTCCVVDQGLHVELACRLARDFGKVLYFQNWKWSFPRLMDVAVGEGVPGIQRIYNLWNYIDKVDLFVFPDVLDGDMQVYLRNQGHRVWGSGRAERLELNRGEFQRIASELGVKTPETQKIVGIDNLRSFLDGCEDKWLKVSRFRGDFETYHHLKPFTSEPFLNDVQKKLGPLGRQMEFLVSDHVDGVELAYDGFTVDGQFPDKALFGYEVKDCGYVGKVKSYAELPKTIRDVNAAMTPVLAEMQCRSFMAFEMRVGADSKPVVVDPCMRCGSPPTEVNMELWSNLSEVLWSGAMGDVVSPEPVAPYAVMAIVKSNYANGNWMAVDIPPDVRQWAKLKNLCVLDGRHYFVPGDVPLPEIGAVVGLGQSLEEAMGRVNEIAPRLQGYQLEVCLESLDKAQERIEEGERIGIQF